MEQTTSTNDPMGLHARIAELEAEVARLQQDVAAYVRNDEERARFRLEADEGRVISSFAAAADRREIVSGWTKLAESQAEADAVGSALAELEAIYQVMPIGLAVLDGNLRYVRVNDALARLNGVPVPDHLGRTIREVVPEVADGVETMFRQVFETGKPADPVEFEAATPGTDGGPRVWLDHVTPLKDTQGRSRFVLVTVLDITDRKRMEEALRQSEARFRRTADTAPALLWVTDIENRCTYLSRSWYELTGQTPEEAVGFGWLEAVHPDDAEASGRIFLSAAERRESFRLEYRLRSADGSYRWAIDAGRPHFSEAGEYLGYVGSVIDIDERKAADAELRESEARFRAAVQAVSGVVWTNSADGRMEGEQPGWAALTGQAFTQYQGFGWAAAVHPDDAQATLSAWNTAVASRTTFVFEHRLRCAGDAWRHFAVRATPVLLPDGSIREWVGVHTDITAHREAEAVISRDRAELERLVELRTAALLREVEERRRAEEALRQGEKLQAIGQLTGGIAHDFNNILQVILSGTMLLSSPRLTEERRAAVLAGVNKSAESAKALTSRLLAFARKQTLLPEPSDVAQRLQNMSDLLRQTLGSRIRVETDFADDTWLAHADPNQLEIAVLNLAVNARDAMLPEGGTITLQTRNAHLEATPERSAGDYVCLAVADTGPGISPTVLPRVFEPFFTTKGPDEGTGLGLAQVHGFAKQSGGDIAIESVLGQGTTVRLHLPRATPSQMEVAASNAAQPAAAGMMRISGKTVLVVDDNPDVAAFTASMLEGLGYHTCLTQNAADALALINAGVAIDAVFSDVVMPGEIDGLKLAAKLHVDHPLLAVVLATGYSEVLAECSGRTTAEVLRKPYGLNDVVAALDRAFASVRASAGSDKDEPNAAV